jgi:TonB-linked SusC/RagA family outer membrane protein
MWKYTDPDLGTRTVVEGIDIGGSYNSNDKDGGGGSNTDKNSITSFFGRVGYNYENRYYADFVFRYDGSSKFHKDHRWGFFPSASAAWRISEEGFMDFYKAGIGDLKIRSSYGVLGNQNVGSYDYYTTYEFYTNTYAFDNVALQGTGFTYGNPLLTWEKSGTFNIGLDATFFRNSLSFSVEYFNKKTWDILMGAVVPDAYGTNAPTQNLGEMKNQGWETTIAYRLAHGDFRHNFSLNFADQKNKVTNFGGEEKIEHSDQVYRIVREGEAMSSYFGYKTDGFFQSYDDIENSVLPTGANVQPGDVKYVDSNGDGVFDEKDRVILGNAFPRYTFGFTYDVAWKGIDFSFLIQGVGKRDQFVRGELMEAFHENYSHAIYQHQLDYWTPTNPDARFPRLTAAGSPSRANNWGTSGSDIFHLNAAYLRLKNIQVGYTLPQQLTSKAGIQKLRISVSAQNLFTITKNPFIDPESSEYGSDMGGLGGGLANSARNYPTLKYYGVGLDLEF